MAFFLNGTLVTRCIGADQKGLWLPRSGRRPMVPLLPTEPRRNLRDRLFDIRLGQMEEATMKATSMVLLALSCIAALGCAAAREDQMAAANTSTANVAGQWSGYVQSSGTNVPVTLSLDQNGTNVTGNVTTGADANLSGPVKGTIQGERLRLSLPTDTFSDLKVG